MFITFKHVGFEWPNGQIVFNDLDFSLEQKIYGLVGPNGVGKTTLARLMSGELSATEGIVSTAGHSQVCFFKQSEARAEVTVGEYLAEAMLSYDPFVASITSEIPYERECSSLSGGEWTRVRLAHAVGMGATFLILDEPTNHLDREGREAVHEFLKQYQGGVLIISHDRELLEMVDQIIELTALGISIFGGSWQDYTTQRDHERERLFRDLEVATKNRKDTLRERQKKIERQDKRQRTGAAAAARGGMPKILLGARKRRAQVTQGSIDQDTMDEVNNSVTEAFEAYQQLKVDPVMYARLPAINLPHGKTVIEAQDFNFRFDQATQNLWPQNLTVSFRGPARVAIRGPNGSGKSTLLRLLHQEALRGQSTGLLRMGAVQAVFLDQEHSHLNQSQSALDNIRDSAKLEESELRSLLAMFLLKGEILHQPVSSLSGGERLRVALAQAFLANPPANVLFLDEPTNNLDIPNIEFLESLLKQYKGALIVVSHDKKFLERLDLTDEIQLKGNI